MGGSCHPFPKKIEAQMIPIVYIFYYGQYSWCGFFQMVDKSKILIEGSGRT